MKYFDGKDVKLGDKVKLWKECHGIVVCSIDTGDYSPAFTAKEWSYLKKGIVIDSDKAGVVHYAEPDEDFELIEREEST